MKTFFAMLLLIGLTPVHAADPAEGTLTLDELSLEYTGGPFVNANALHQSDSGANGPTCAPPVLECDEFALTLDFPEAIEEVYPSAVVRIAWGWEDISGAGLIDFDCWIYDGEGNVQETSGAGSNNPESAAFLLYGGVHNYTLTCAPFLALGDSYTGTVEVVLGEPVEPDDAESDMGAAFAGVLVPSGQDEQDADARSAEAGSSGGALGGALMVLGLLGLRRKFYQ